VGLIVFGKLSPEFLSERMSDIMHEKFALKPGSDAYFDWLATQRTADVKFYVFNVTNADDVIAYGAKPKVKELGPYTYDLKRSRTDLQFNDEDRQSQLSYTQTESYTRSRSNDYSWQSNYGRDPPPSSSVVTVNIPILTLATWLESIRSVIDLSQSIAVAEIMKNLREHLFTTVSVEDLLWGYKSQGLVQTNNMLKERLRFTPFDDTTFGLLYRQGEPMMTRKESVRIKTGVDDLYNLRLLMSWNNKVPTINDDCYPHRLTDETEWAPSLKWYYDWNSMFDRNGIRLALGSDWCSFSCYRLREELPSWSYLNSNCPDAQCSQYTLSKSSIDDARETCQDNYYYPIFLSQPHFYSAARQYRDAVEGLDPTNYKHETTMTVEQFTAQMIGYTRRIQYNVQVKQLSAFSETSELPYEGLIIPVAWKEETYSEPYDVQSTIYANARNIKIMKKIAIWLPFGTVVLGSVIIGCLGLFLIITTARRLRTCIRERQATRYDRSPLNEHLDQKPENIAEIRKGYIVLA